MNRKFFQRPLREGEPLFNLLCKPPEIRGNKLVWSPEGEFRACVIWLKQK
jgi:hypothetical protein